MPILDIILLLCFIPAIVGGLSKGFVKQAAGLVTILLAAWAAFHLSAPLGAWLGRFVSWDPSTLRVIAFILIVIAATLLFGLLASLVTKALGALSLGFFNRLLGLVFAVLKTVLVLGLLILLFEVLNEKLHLVDADVTGNSTIYHAIKDVANRIFPILKTFITNTVDA